MNIEHLNQFPLKTLIALTASLFMCAYGVIGIFLAYRKLEAMESLLNKCRFIAFHRSFWGDSLRGKMMRLSMVYVAIALPKRNARRAIIDVQQVRDFPKGMKRLLHFTASLGVLGLMGAAFFTFLIN